MRTALSFTAAVVPLVMLLATSASGGIIITQTAAPAPTYATTLDFDELGGPTGSVASDGWSASHGVTSLVSGVGNGFVGDMQSVYPWLPDNSNMLDGPFGVFMNFDADLSELSAQVWDNSGPAGPFGGGMGIFVFDDGVEVGAAVFTPAWGGLGDSWFDITTTDGSVFDEVRFVGFGFAGPETIVDNLSWNTVPAPGSFALLAVAGLMGSRRRRT